MARWTSRRPTFPGFDGFAIKVSPGFFDNPKLGLPSLNGLMILFSAKTGLVEAVFLDNGYLTDIRTAAAGAVAARHLAPQRSRPPASSAPACRRGCRCRRRISCGPFERVLVWGRDPEKAAACASRSAAALGVEAEMLQPIPRRWSRASQLVVTTTPAREPVLQAEWLHPGLHITAMGSDQAGKNEIAPAALARADLYVADRVSQGEILGELRAALAAGLMTETPPELGEIVTGAQGAPASIRHHHRRPDRHGAQDTAIASHVAARLGDAGTLVKA